jgi:type VI secretion system protein ImpJ
MSLNKVIWAEGILLGPQHFQQWDRYIEQRQHILVRSIAPLSWGIIEMTIDHSALLRGNFRVQHCQAIFPNGQIVDFQETQAEELSCKLKESQNQKISIYLCVPTNNQVNAISGYPATTPLSSYYANYRQVADEYDSQREREILFGRLNIMLLQDGDDHEKINSLKIAEVVSQGNKKNSLDEKYIPPIIHIRSSRVLTDLVRRILELISAKAYVITERRQQFHGDITDFYQNDITHFLLLKTFNVAIVQLKHALEQSYIAPQQVYAMLVQLLASLQAFTRNNKIETLPSYQHEEQGATFYGLEAILQDLLEQVIPIQIQTLKLQRESDTLYVVDSIDSQWFTIADFYLAVNFSSEEMSWITHFIRQTKVAARSNIETIITSALPGIKLVHSQRPPQKLPIKSGCEYFYLEPIGEFWQQIMAERTLVLFLPKIFELAKVEIITLKTK